MTLLRFGNELVNSNTVELFKHYAEDNFWIVVKSSTSIELLENAELILLNDGMVYNRTTGRWFDFWQKGFYPESQAFKQRQTLRDISEKLVTKNDKPKKAPTVPFKYDEATLLKEFTDYVSATYKQHYVGENNVQSLDLIFALGMGKDFCKGNGIKYLARSGKKDGQERNDLLKTMHYTMLALYLYDKQAAKED